jgi:hypothetical protein
MRKEKEIQAIERQLHAYQSQILIRLHVMFRYSLPLGDARHDADKTVVRNGNKRISSPMAN